MQQVIHTAKSKLHGNIKIPGSQSMTYRAIILAALADGVSELTGIRISTGTTTLLNALHQVGIVVQPDEATHSCIIAGGNGKLPKKQTTVWCNHSKTVSRYLLTLCAHTHGTYYFDGEKSLRKQLDTSLITILCRQGVQLDPSNTSRMPFTMIGAESLEGGDIMLQNATAKSLLTPLLLISPFARSPFNLSLQDTAPSSLADMTSGMMADFGVLVHRIHQGQYVIPVPQRYHAKDFHVEPDFSLAIYFYAAAAITGGEVTIPDIKREHTKQSDIKFLATLEKMGCHLTETPAGLTVKGPNELQGIEINLRHFSDIFTALIAMAPFAKSPTRISHHHQLSAKELKRLSAIKTEFAKLDVHIEKGKDWVQIFPSTPKGCTVTSHNDRRVAMALSLIGLKTPGVIIEDTSAVTNAYPEFFTLWDRLSAEENVGGYAGVR